MGRVGEGVSAESVDVFIAAGQEVLEVGFVDQIAFGLQLLESLLYVRSVGLG